jgi:hypothetical protein
LAAWWSGRAPSSLCCCAAVASPRRDDRAGAPDAGVPIERQLVAGTSRSSSRRPPDLSLTAAQFDVARRPARAGRVRGLRDIATATRTRGRRPRRRCLIARPTDRTFVLRSISSARPSARATGDGARVHRSAATGRSRQAVSVPRRARRSISRARSGSRAVEQDRRMLDGR